MKLTKSFCIGLAIAILATATQMKADIYAPTNSTEAILHHAPFFEGLDWIGTNTPTQADSDELWAILQGVKTNPDWPAQVENYLRTHPDSPWAASLHHAYACFCQRTGRTTKALSEWEAAWGLVKNDASIKGKRLGGSILASWMSQLSSLGRRDKLKELIAAGNHWQFVKRRDRDTFEEAKYNYLLMGKHPEMSFRCGTFALRAVGQTLQPENPKLQSLVEKFSPTNGFSLAGLAKYAKEYGLDLVPARRLEGQELIVPSVVHWRQNHYAAILKQTNDLYLVNDPTFGTPKWMTGSVINEEASGEFLIPSGKLNPEWAQLAPEEAEKIRGMGEPCTANDNKDKPCPQDFSGSTTCTHCPDSGMPVWWVSEPYINLWIGDKPLSYLTSQGQPFTFEINYKQRGEPTASAYHYAEIADTGWNHSWFSYIELVSEYPYVQHNPPIYPPFNQYSAALQLPGGGEVDFPTGQTYDPETRLTIQPTDPSYPGVEQNEQNDQGVRVIHADGAQDIYSLLANPDTAAVAGEQVQAFYLLTYHIDPHGNTTTYNYVYNSSAYVLQSVVDPDGRTNTLSYTYNSSLELNALTAVTNAYGKSTHFSYDSNGNLTNLTDAQGLSSSLTYDTNGYPTKLITPYGTNQFFLYVANVDTNTEGNMGGDDTFGRAAVVTDPVGGNHLYLFRQDCTEFMPTNYDSSTIPTNTPLGTLDTGLVESTNWAAICHRNSFSWNARQCASLSINNFSATNLNNLTTNDYLRGRMKHWLQDTNALNTVSEYLSVERDPSPDGTVEGLKTFYDYQGKTYPYMAGTNPLPSVKAWRLPNGETHYDYLRFDPFGNITNEVSTYTTAAGVLGTRTNQFIYATNKFTNVWGYLSGNTLVPVHTNTFSIASLLTKVIAPDGSNTWSFGGFDSVIWTNTFYDPNSQTYFQFQLSSLRSDPRYITNAVNQVTSLTYAPFDRVTSIQWPAGLTTTNIYNTNGFLVQTIDEQINRTNAFAYSTNGLPSVRTNELGLVVNFYWDNLLRLTGASFPDGTTVSNVYTILDLNAHKDRVGNWTLYQYDGLRHLTTITNANSNVTSFGWCDCGALTSLTDPLTNTITLNYDFQSRLTNILFPDTSSLNFQYDLSGRMTNRVDGLNRGLSFYYDNQGLVTNVSNGYGNIASVVLDILDRPASFTDANGVTVTNSYDELNRILTRTWTADGLGDSFLYATNGLVAYTNRDQQPTRFGRDPAGRLTVVTNADLQTDRFAYDSAGHLTNLVDGLSHATTWNFNQYGWLTNKVDASNHVAFLYTYNANGWLTNRWMPASGNTQYKFDAVGNLTNIVYSNAATASISYFYDADNRLTNMADAVGTTVLTYTPTGQPATESNPFSSTTGTLDFLYSQGHRTNLSLSQPSGPWNQSYFYDNEWRMTGITSPAGSFAYGYPNSASALIQSLALPNVAGITYQYDALARLTNTSLANYWGQVLDGYGYAYDAIGLRTNISRYLGITTNNISAGYDNISQLISWTAKETSGTARLNEQLGYGYDAANNLQARTNNALAQTFTVDALNQLSTVTRTGTLTESGATPAPATNITVNGSTAQTYGDFTFARTNLTLANGNNSFTNIAQNVYGVTVTNIVAANLPSPVTFLYDANGNLTNDGTRTFVYDAENQLTNVNTPGAWKTEYVYDGFRRKRISRDYTWSGTWVKTNETRYLYDGMLVIQERDTNNNPLVTYTRGLDVSGSRTRAGGIGGLLARADTSGSAFYHADGNGNITSLIDNNQNIVARYEYDAFGRLIGKWGALADANVYRFSSKEFQRTSGLYAYGFRFYEPNLQRWVNRDPIGVKGGLNPYGFTLNSSANIIDLWGLLASPGPPLSQLAAAPETAAASTAASAAEGTAEVAGEVALESGPYGWLAAGVVLSVPLDAAMGYAILQSLDMPPGPTTYPGTDPYFNPYGVNGPPNAMSDPSKGWTGTDGQYQDAQGNTRDAAGNIVKDKNGNGPTKCNKKPKLVSNPKHNPNSANPEPKNVKDLFDKSIPDDTGRRRWAIDDDGDIHRFMSDNNDNWHWNGSTGDDDPIPDNHIPNSIKKTLGY